MNISLVSALYLINIEVKIISIIQHQLGHIVVLTCVRRKSLGLAVLINQVLVGRVDIIAYYVTLVCTGGFIGCKKGTRFGTAAPVMYCLLARAPVSHGASEVS